jgi:hypothetical protein
MSCPILRPCVTCADEPEYRRHMCRLCYEKSLRAQKGPVACRHCGVLAGPHARRWRGLCSRCYRTPAIMAIYPRRGGGPGADRNQASPLSSASTDAVPGSAEKIAVLAERARKRQALFHPGDAPPDSEAVEAGGVRQGEGRRVCRLALPRNGCG